MHTKWESQVLVVALVLLGGKLAAADHEKMADEEPAASFRAYLPTIRLKALLDNERQSVADLETWLRKYDHAYIERLHHLEQSWPALAPVKIKDVDLLACKRDKAEETVTSLLKTPDAQREGRKRIRHLRTQAESYPIQQRLFQLVFLLREDKAKWPSAPPPDHAGDILLPESIGPVVQRPSRADPDLATELLLKAEASSAWIKRQLLQTWIDYQIVRLDLYADLGMSPP
jgi:hypothetical protein